MDYYAKHREAALRVADLLEKPMAEDSELQSYDDFDPWDLFPAIYGSYSSEFDDMAIRVLENIADREFDDEGLAHHIFREMLCTADLCDYGTSPRVCFPTMDFEPLLPMLIERWKEYRKLHWS